MGGRRNECKKTVFVMQKKINKTNTRTKGTIRTVKKPKADEKYQKKKFLEV